MNRQQVDSLIGRYYEGLTSEEEESRLRELLGADDLPQEYFADREIVLSLASSAAPVPEPDEGFESRISAAIEATESRNRLTGLKRRIYSTVTIAATFLVVISSWFILDRNREPADTFSDPVLAYNATVEVLREVSEKLNTGRGTLDELSVISSATGSLIQLSEQQKIVSKHIEPLGLLKEKEGADLEPVD